MHSVLQEMNILKKLTAQKTTELPRLILRHTRYKSSTIFITLFNVFSYCILQSSDVLTQFLKKKASVMLMQLEHFKRFCSFT